MTCEDDPPEDDLSICPTTDLFRRVPPDHYKNVGGEWILRDGFFKNHPQPERKRASVALGDTLAALRRGPESILGPGQEAYGVVAIKASAVRKLAQRIERDPKPEEPAHGGVYGEKPVGWRKRLIAEARWVVLPPSSQQTAG